MASLEKKGETIVSMHRADLDAPYLNETCVVDGIISPVQCPSSINEKTLVRKIDRRLLPMLFVVYTAAFLDRVNISNALTMNLPQDLHLVGQQPNVALTIFFVPYVIFEIPSNLLMKRLKPHIWMSGCVLAFGVVTLCQGFVQSYGGLLATRFLLGLAEAGIFPGSFYLISFWYKREESLQRFTIFYSSVLFASAFGGLLASAIANMNGIHGLSNWRWIFILEGIGTILVGVVSYFWISDFPEEAQWLTEEERQFVRARAGTDKESARAITYHDILWFFTDLKRILGGIMYFSIVVPIYAYAYFAPTIIRTLGYSVVQTQLHSVPPVAAAFALCLIVAYLSDFTRLRFPFIAFGTALTLTGLVILITVHNFFSLQYAALCLVAMGSFSAGIVIICWYIMNLHGHTERNIGTAWMISFGNTGAIIATFSFLKADAPLYNKGYAICIGAICLTTLSTITYAGLIWKERRRMSRVTTGNEKEAIRYYTL